MSFEEKASEDTLQLVLTAVTTPALPAAAWVDTTTSDVIENGAWAYTDITLGADQVNLSALSHTLDTIAALTSYEWYLAWDTAGDYPITDVETWTLGTDIAPGVTATKRVAVAKIDLIIKRPTGVGTASTCYLHHKGADGTANLVCVASGTK